MEAQLQLVHYYLDNELNENALFVTERLHVLDPNEPTWTHLRSLSCLRLGQYALASEYSRNVGIKGEHLGCCYIFALSCLHQKNYAEGIKALQQARSLWATQVQTGTPLQVANIFQLRNIPLDIKPIKGASMKPIPEEQGIPNLMTKRIMNRRRSPLIKEIAQPQANGSTPSAGDEIKAARSIEKPATRPRSTLNENDVAGAKLSSSKLPELPRRRSARLMKQEPPVATLTHRPASSSRPVGNTSKRLPRPRIPVRPVEQKASSPNQPANDTKPTISISSPDTKTEEPVSSEPTKARAQTTPSSQTKLQQLIDLLSKLGRGYYHLSRFQPKECLEAFSTLPGDQQATPWVLSKTGRAQYELMSYKEARSTFRILQKIAPSWMEDLEVYSTVLWHLKEDVALAFLAHELSDSHFLSPQTWCAIGNSLSLQKSRDEAIRAFKRACQLYPPLPQAYSLLGYEYMDTEQYAEATTAFRQALQVDPRHYSAWVGLGRIQEKIGQSERALKYYLGAHKINASNAIVMTYIARMLEKTRKPQLALDYLRRGLNLDPPKTTISLIRMQAASIHLRLGQPAKALQDLHLVEQFAPDESQVHFFLGEAYAMSGEGNRHLALKHYTTAQSLAPWNSAKSKQEQDVFPSSSK
ncbi:hypothetical protein G7Z17_g5266 [Cylindrodendrum hubeiense]|uniref:Uncharacterized protein n=1 Tax=Cylindrodendrum hubeiense TaxID=595255 RepID=A0A9P5HC94_9HYPO|nr:hypothetical protein G7Z17_g5266 [Cylindrodendrum hubeiense]